MRPKGAPTGETPGVPKEVDITIVDIPTTRSNELPSAELNIATVLMPTAERTAPTVEPFQGELITGGCPYSQAERAPATDDGLRITFIE